MVAASALITKEKIELKYKLQHFHKSFFSKKTASSKIFWNASKYVSVAEQIKSKFLLFL